MSRLVRSSNLFRCVGSSRRCIEWPCVANVTVARRQLIFIRVFSSRHMARDRALRLLNLQESHVLTQEIATDAFRKLAKRLHPDVPGGSKEAFQEAQTALATLLEQLPTDDDLLRIRKLEVDAREEARFRARQGKGDLLASPKGILHKLTLTVKETVQESLFRSKSSVSDYKYDRLRHEARSPEATGRDVMSAEDVMLEKELEEVKLQEIRTKGVGRMVDRLISDAIKRGEFKEVQGKGKKIEEDYFEAHLATGSALERKLQAILKDEGFLPEWIELAQKRDEVLKQLRAELAKELKFVATIQQRSPFGKSLIDLREYRELVLQEPKVVSLIEEVKTITKRYNMLCPTPLQSTAWSKQFLMAMLDEELEKVLNETGTSSKA